MTPQSVQTAVKLDQSGRNKITLLKVVLPIVAGVLGLAALVTGILLARRRPGSTSRDEAASPPAASRPASWPDRPCPLPPRAGGPAAGSR